MPQYNRNDLEIAARNQHFTRDLVHDNIVVIFCHLWILRTMSKTNVLLFEFPRFRLLKPSI